MDAVKQTISGVEAAIGLAQFFQREKQKMLNYQTRLRVGTKPQKRFKASGQK